MDRWQKNVTEGARTVNRKAGLNVARQKDKMRRNTNLVGENRRLDKEDCT